MATTMNRHVRSSRPGSHRGVVLLGASNLAMGLPEVLATLRGQDSRPLRVLAARGHGRSYPRRSRVLLRDLPGILECGLWRALPDLAAAGSIDAVMTDVGNDIVYGLTPDALIGHVDDAIGRLDRTGARILVTRLPIDALEGLSRFRFEVVRRLIFPSHPLEFDRMLAYVRETDERLGELTRTRGITSVPMDPAWYGLDPVHFLPRRRREAWETILAPWKSTPGSFPKFTRGSFRGARRAKPARWWFAGRERTRVQPAGAMADGSELWLY